jgi:hypothetical protein
MQSKPILLSLTPRFSKVIACVPRIQPFQRLLPWPHSAEPSFRRRKASRFNPDFAVGAGKDFGFVPL